MSSESGMNDDVRKYAFRKITVTIIQKHPFSPPRKISLFFLWRWYSSPIWIHIHKILCYFVINWHFIELYLYENYIFRELNSVISYDKFQFFFFCSPKLRIKYIIHWYRHRSGSIAIIMGSYFSLFPEKLFHHPNVHRWAIREGLVMIYQQQ